MGNGRFLKEGWYRELEESLPRQLPAFLAAQRWYGGKARHLRSAELLDAIVMRSEAVEALVLVVRVVYAHGPDGTYVIPALCGEHTAKGSSAGEAAWLHTENSSGAAVQVFADALQDEAFLKLVLGAFHRQSVFAGRHGELRAVQTTACLRLFPPSAGALQPKVVRAEQSNSSVIYGERLILKFFRRIEEGINPDLEVGTFLTEQAQFPHIPELAGSLEYITRDGRKMALGMLQAFVPNQGDAWSYTIKRVNGYYDRVGAAPGAAAAEGKTARRAGEETMEGIAFRAAEAYLGDAELLGKRTAQLHLALASGGNDTAFAPESFTMEFQRAIERSLIELTAQVFTSLRDKLGELPVAWRGAAEEVGRREAEIVGRFQAALKEPIAAVRTRIHGDYHLGQVLYTGTDFVVIDFEGEPARPLAERRLKRSPLQDVAGMLRSFHYAAFAPLVGALPDLARPAGFMRLHGWAELWTAGVSKRFLASYFETSGSAAYLPPAEAERTALLDLHLLEKAVYELGYELNNRPLWVGIPLGGILQIVSA